MPNKNVQKTLKMWNREYKKGLFSYLILLFLKEKSMYGFEISRKLSGIIDPKVSFEESGIYHALKKLKEKKFVTSEWQRSDKGPKRKYYTITESGRELILQFTKIYIIPINGAINQLITEHFPNLIQGVKKNDENAKIKY